MILALLLAAAGGLADVEDASRVAAAETNVMLCAREAELLGRDPAKVCGRREDDLERLRAELRTVIEGNRREFEARLNYLPRGCRIQSPERRDAPKREYRSVFPCPVTGKKTGACPGWELDHIVPLCCGGADEWTNLRWMEVDLHRLRHRDGNACWKYPLTPR